MTLDLYEDGDHVADGARYTRIFSRRLDAESFLATVAPVPAAVYA
jgi:hypothetical protein